MGHDSQPLPVELRPTQAHVGRYALKGLLGTGGLGQVHEAWDPLLSRAVAVKMLQFDSDPAVRQQLDDLFLNEARAAAGLSHAHIVTVHDAGLSEHGVYIAMERLQGQDLRQRLAGGWLPTPAQAAQLVRRVADALAYAHARGVVHCDIKPANIFLNKRDKPKVLDFGIARIANSRAVPLLEGAVAGSPHYLAPEQFLGQAVDARTDIHALGVVFYELLTLRRAFPGDTVEQISTAVLTNHPAPAHEVRPGVPRTLAGIAAKAMAREPGNRYVSAAEMAADLRRWAERHPHHEAETELPRSTPPAEAAPAQQAQLTGRLPAAALLLGAVAAGAIAMAALSRRPAPVTDPPPPPVAAAPGAAAPPAAVPAAEAAAVPADAATPPTTTEAPGLAAPAAARPAVAAKPKTAAPARDARPQAAPAPTAAPPVTGQLQLAITPWGQVEVDGQPAGTTPPLTRLTLSEGTHSITVRNEDFPPFTVVVQVSADKPVTVRHRFNP
ncbi:MAG: serine/threonine protein kinase [Rubrivivax sp.]|nr:serine/threonine protein kinase [Rubrivivax sp.]